MRARFQFLGKAIQMMALLAAAWSGSIVVRNVTEGLIALTGRNPALVLDHHRGRIAGSPVAGQQAGYRQAGMGATR